MCEVIELWDVVGTARVLKEPRDGRRVTGQLPFNRLGEADVSDESICRPSARLQTPGSQTLHSG